MGTATPTHVFGHFGFDPATLGGVLQPFQQRLAPAVLRPPREQRGLQAPTFAPMPYPMLLPTASLPALGQIAFAGSQGPAATGTAPAPDAVQDY